MASEFGLSQPSPDKDQNSPGVQAHGNILAPLHTFACGRFLYTPCGSKRFAKKWTFLSFCPTVRAIGANSLSGRVCKSLLRKGLCFSFGHSADFGLEAEMLRNLAFSLDILGNPAGDT